MARFITFAKVSSDLDMNRKIRRGGRNAREIYLFVLRQVAARDTSGFVPMEDMDEEYLADVLMMPVTDARDGVTRCRDVKLLAFEGDRCLVVGWDDEWGKRPMTDGERASKYRASKNKKQVSHETVTDRHEANVTQRDCHAIEENRIEENRDGGELHSLELISDPETTPEQKPEPALALTSACCEVLNRELGSKFQPGTLEPLDHARKLVKRKITAPDVLAVTADRVRAWRHDTKMSEYLTPSTILRPSKFVTYLDNLRARPSQSVQVPQSGGEIVIPRGIRTQRVNGKLFRFDENDCLVPFEEQPS